MKPVDQLCSEIDAALAVAGLRCVGGPFVARKYEATFDGRPLRATLSVFLDTGNRFRGSTLQAVSYQVTIELENGLPTRWLAARFVPLLLRAGLPTIATLANGAEFRADDAAWSSARFGAGEGRAAIESLAAHAELVEQRPGLFQVQMRRIADAPAPDFRAELDAFATIARLSAQPPAPKVAASRFTDHRSLMLALIAVVVLGGALGCVASYVALVG